MNLLFLILFMGTTAEKLISHDEVEHLFKKFVKNELTKGENETLNDVFEILRTPEFRYERPYGSSIKMSLLCLGCRLAAATFIDGVTLGLTDAVLAGALNVLCTLLHIGTQDVCVGIVSLQMPILTYIVKHTPEATAKTFCGIVLQSAEDPNVCPFDDPRFEWHVDLPDAPVMNKRPPISTFGNTPLTVGLITDVHLDPLYKPGGVADCGEPTCCREGQTQVSNLPPIQKSIYEKSLIRNNGDMLLDLHIAEDIRKIRSSQKILMGKESAPAGYWGDYRNCDTPLWAFDDVIERIADAHRNVDVVYYIGDTIDHHIWETTHERNREMSSYVVNKIRRVFGDHVTFVPVIGNHEAQPVNQFAPSTVTDGLNTTWLYESLARKWDHYVPSFLKGGDYSVLVRPGLRAIVLNNIVAYRFNWWQIYNPLEAKKHLDWLVYELHKAEVAGEKVHILTHIPPGEADLTRTWTREYNRIVNRFASTIAAEFNGHTHSDEFRIFYTPAGKPVRVAWNGGGISTYFNFNPNYKTVTFDPVTYEPTNINNYIYNLTHANLSPKSRPTWYKLYDFKQKFQLPDLSPSSMDKLVTRMVTDDKHLLDLYSDYYYKMGDARPECDEACKLEELCNTVVTVLWERKKCDDLKKLYHG